WTIEKGQVSMGRRRGEDLDVARLREIRERADEVPTKTRSVCLSQPAVRADVEARELRAALIRRFRKAANVVLGSRDLVVDVFERADVDVTVGKLFDQDGREPDNHPVRDTGLGKVVQ